MKMMLYYSVVLIMVLTSMPGQAQESLALYDNFEVKFLDPIKWLGAEALTNAGSLILESSRQIKKEPIYGYKGLNILHRGYGGTTVDSGISFTSTRLVIPDGSDVETLQATVQVKHFQAVGCTDNPEATEVRARISGYFFNTDIPTPGSAVNDVFAYIIVRRLSSSSARANVLEVVGRVMVCHDNNCNNVTLLGSADLGTVLLNQKVKLRMTWDKINQEFIFQKGRSPEYHVYYGDSVSDTAPPGMANGGSKRLEVVGFVANCATEPRPVGFMEAFFDNVFVNASAIL